MPKTDKNEMKYIYPYTKNRYVLKIKGKGYGVYSNKNDAISVRDEIINSFNNDLENRDLIKCNNMKYIYISNDKYIVKIKNKWHGIYNTINEAIIVRDETLKKNLNLIPNWKVRYDKYIYITDSKKYLVRINGVSFGLFEKNEDAVSQRDCILYNMNTEMNSEMNTMNTMNTMNMMNQQDNEYEYILQEMDNIYRSSNLEKPIIENGVKEFKNISNIFLVEKCNID